MTDKEAQWFALLTKDREESANTFAKPSMRGVQRSVVDKYSDQAHFIYELLQNADDAGATSANFRIEKDGLFFQHNGKVHFTLSDPAREEEDTREGRLGHINAITSIANSNKNESSIGKFGVGFKAVFQYTETPHIYDPKIRFKIERFIVPVLLEEDLAGRGDGETVFFFPFDHRSKSPEESYDDISEKLKALDSPVLFLSSLESVSFEAGETTGKYVKRVTKRTEFDEIHVRWLDLVLEVNGEEGIQKLLLFTCANAANLPCSIGYGLDASGRLKSVKRPAFCFFPTKETTGLSFIIHAPFLLTDSREGIKAGDPHNAEMVQQLADLAAESLKFLKHKKLIDDGILDLIPYDESVFANPGDRSRISFKPFYDKLKGKLQSGAFLPGGKGKYAGRDRAYWASDTDLVDLFSDRQLQQLTGTDEAQWILRGLGKKEVLNAGNKALAEYIDGGDARAWIQKEPNLIVASFDPDAILRRIDEDFISSQAAGWLHKFYAYLAERASYQKNLRSKPIFLDQSGNAVPAFDDNDELVLFFPDDEIDGYTTVNKVLLSNKDTKEFIAKFGVKKPSLRHEIYNKILPAYETDDEVDTAPHFAKFFRYYKECRNDEVDDFIELIKDKKFLHYSSAQDETTYRGKAEDLYWPTPELRLWFEPSPETRFISLEDYRDMVEEEDHGRLMEFFKELGVARSPRVLEVGVRRWSGRSGSSNNDKTIDGLDSFMEGIDRTRSIILWSTLTSYWSFLSEAMKVLKSNYGPRGGHYGSYWSTSKAANALRSKKWLINNLDQIVAVSEVTIQTLSDQYDTTSHGALDLIRFLNLHNEAEDTAHLSEEEVRKIRLAEEIENSGLSEDEIRQALDEAKRRKTATPEVPEPEVQPDPQPSDLPLIRDILRRRANGNRNGEAPQKGAPASGGGASTDETEDSDDFNPRAVDFGKKIERAKDRCAEELDQLERQQALHDQANNLPRYSYGWFLAMLELECLASEESGAGSKTISIRFGKVERDPLSPRSIVLKQPNRFVPPSIEEFSGVRVDFELVGGQTGKARVESFTAREFSLHAKLEDPADLNGVKLGDVLEARIEIKNPSFLLQELLNRFHELNLGEQFDMRKNLTPDIEFVFGPPGTGKTTHLAENVLIPRMKDENLKVLVLAPTNKAADVLTSRIIEKMGDDLSYLSWLVRFGTSADERIEAAGVWRDRSFDIAALERSVTITTVARFAYDGFSGSGGRKLHEIDWDLIIVDEASMVPLAAIVYPLFRRKPWKFIIAGDPFQIEPIVAVDQWKEENIYTFVGLANPGSFSNPVTVPHAYKVLNLDTQYRSVPAIGEVFSRFSYDGRLRHHRPSTGHRPLRLDGFHPKPINLIKFPVSKYESIYRARKLDNRTPYQTYSALFTFELLRWMSAQLADEQDGVRRIGVIAPYRAQANILNRLNDSWDSKPQNVEIQVGTIHGFQGDECDIIITVLNPPPYISSSPRMFLNKKNILNVAASRARDYLFIVMPDDETVGRENLKQIRSLEAIISAGGDFSEYHSHEIENLIWGQANYLEENTYSTGHQMVNVYRRPERYYEVRSDDSAVDIQIHETPREGQNTTVTGTTSLPALSESEPAMGVNA
jgi:hypothetical protein